MQHGFNKRQKLPAVCSMVSTSDESFMQCAARFQQVGESFLQCAAWFQQAAKASCGSIQ